MASSSIPNSVDKQAMAHQLPILTEGLVMAGAALATVTTLTEQTNDVQIQLANDPASETTIASLGRLVDKTVAFAESLGRNDGLFSKHNQINDLVNGRKASPHAPEVVAAPKITGDKSGLLQGTRDVLFKELHTVTLEANGRKNDLITKITQFDDIDSELVRGLALQTSLQLKVIESEIKTVFSTTRIDSAAQSLNQMNGEISRVAKFFPKAGFIATARAQVQTLGAQLSDLNNERQANEAAKAQADAAAAAAAQAKADAKAAKAADKKAAAKVQVDPAFEQMVASTVAAMKNAGLPQGLIDQAVTNMRANQTQKAPSTPLKADSSSSSDSSSTTDRTSDSSSSSSSTVQAGSSDQAPARTTTDIFGENEALFDSLGDVGFEETQQGPDWSKLATKSTKTPAAKPAKPAKTSTSSSTPAVTPAPARTEASSSLDWSSFATAKKKPSSKGAKTPATPAPAQGNTEARLIENATKALAKISENHIEIKKSKFKEKVKDAVANLNSSQTTDFEVAFKKEAGKTFEKALKKAASGDKDARATFIDHIDTVLTNFESAALKK
jgi:hypothetical protein